MLRNDEVFWKPNAETDAVSLSWGGSQGDFSQLWKHSQDQWEWIVRNLNQIGLTGPNGRIVEFGSGMGLIDDLLQDRNSSILMLDHTDEYIKKRSQPLSSRCRHVLWTSQNLEDLHSEYGSYDWLISIAVFFHLDEITSVALILELGKLLKPGGYVLIQGWNSSTPEAVRQRANRQRLFSHYADYLLNANLLKDALAPDYPEISRQHMLLYQKT